MKKIGVVLTTLCAFSASLSLSLVGGGLANADDSDPTKTYRVKISAVDSYDQQFEDSIVDIVKGESYDGELVDTCWSVPCFVELADGTYTLDIFGSPYGHKSASPQTFIVNKPETWTDPTIGNTYKASTISEVVYSLNSDKESPEDNIDYIKLDGSGDVLSDAVSTTKPQDGDELRGKLMSVIYNGYPNNNLHIQGSLSNDEFRMLTQQAIWDTVNGTPASTIYEGEKKEVYNKLMEYTQNVPKDLEVHTYKVKDSQKDEYQSLIGTEFAEKAAPMEVTVEFEIADKMIAFFKGCTSDDDDDDEYRPLPGASLEIRNEAGETIEQWTSGDDPQLFTFYAPGTYTFHETQAPQGYDIADDIIFRIDAAMDIYVKDGDEWVYLDHTAEHFAYIKMIDPPASITPPATGTGTLVSAGATVGLPLVLMIIAFALYAAVRARILSHR